MPDLKSPFVTKPMACPMCGKASPQRFFRKRLYIPIDKEADQHVLAFKWLQPDVEPFHPPHYFLSMCPECWFTDIAEDFIRPQASIATSTMKKVFHKSGSMRVVFQLLGQHIDYDAIDAEGAINMHLLAIMIHSLPADRDLRDMYRLGRLYMRLAWLYREKNQGIGQLHSAASSSPEADADVVQAQNCAEELHDAVAAFSSQVSAGWEAVNRLLRQRIREIAMDKTSTGMNPYPTRFSALAALVKQQENQLAMLVQVSERDTAGLLIEHRAPKESESEPAKRSLFASQKDLLQRVKKTWKDIPLNEADAIDHAIECYKHALAVDTRFDSFESHLKGSMQVVSLMMYCGNHEGALEIVRGIYGSATQTRQKAQVALKSDKLPADRRRRIESAAKRAGEALERVGELRHEIEDLIAARP